MFRSKKITLGLVLVSLVVFGGGFIVLAKFTRIDNPSTSTTPFLSLNYFKYGYGYGYSQGYGYGYGYAPGNIFSNSTDPLYGFFGPDGTPTITSVTDTTTSFTVNFSTDYVTKNVKLGYATPADILLHQATGSVSEGIQNSGPRSLTITNLSCGQLYYYALNATDIGGNHWKNPVLTTTTASCGGPENTGGVTPLIPVPTNIVTAVNSSDASSVAPNTELGYQFLRNLRQGMRGTDVFNLQKFLNAHSIPVSAEGHPGSSGQETNYYGSATMKAVAQFQKINSESMNLSVKALTGGSGLFGPITRAFVNGLLSQGK